jgi:DNA mismatch repair protein MutS
MPFQSILDLDSGAAAPEQPSFFGDLNLDQLVEQATAGRAQYELAPFFYRSLSTVDGVRYRHETFRDLEGKELLAAVRAFAEQMRTWRARLGQIEKLYYAHQRERLFVAAVQVYCHAVSAFAGRLGELEVRSRAFAGLREYITAYVGGTGFKALVDETEQLAKALAQIRFTVQIRGGRVTVDRYAEERDYSAEIAEVFAKFRRDSAKQIQLEVPNPAQMNHVEAQIIDRVELLYQDPFAALHSYCERHADHLDPVLGRFEREIQFYLAYLEYVEPLRAAGLPFCYPRVSARSKEIQAEEAFDLVLAAKRIGERTSVVTNDFKLSGPERIFVVTGPNNGGKTTFARMVGQLHHLACLGLPVPGTSARLMLPDRVFSHFEREEDIATLRGKLEDELIRIREVLEQASASSLIVMNESFSSTTLDDARFLGTEMIRRIVERDCLAVYVTFVDELAALNQATVSMVAKVAPDDPSVRTFRVVREPANGLAYAAAIAEKYGLTYESVRRRVAA